MPWWSSPSPEGGGVEALVQRLVETSSRAEIVALLNAATGRAEVGRVAAHRLCEAFEAEIAFVIACGADGCPAQALGCTGLTAEQAATLGAAALCRQALGADGVACHRDPALLDLGIRRLALCPWRSDLHAPVLVGVARLYDEAFAPRELALLEAITDSVGSALERAWLSAEHQRRAAQQAALARAAKALGASLVREEVLHTLCAEVAQAMEADTVAVYLQEEGGLELSAGLGVPEGAVGRPCSTRSHPLCARVARSRRPVVSRQLSARGRAAAAELRDVRSALAAPLSRLEGVDGVLIAGFRTERPIPEQEVDLLGAFAELAAAACRNADEYAAMTRAAALDSLTGCLNHGAFQARLREEIERSRRTGGSLALAMLDVNDFKGINDRFGHLSGDAVLRSVAELLRSAVRGYDHVGRFGGDEFAILLPAADADTAHRILDRAVAAASRAPLPEGQPVTVTAGMAHWRAGEEAKELIARADDALLDRKRALGRRSRREAPDGPRFVRAAEPREQQRLRRLATAGSLGTRLARLLDPHAIAETAIAELGAALGYERCLLVRRHEDGSLEVVAAARADDEDGGDGAGAGDGRPEARIPAAMERSVTEQRAVLISDARNDPAYQGRGGGGAGSELGVPVYAGWELWGALGLSSAQAAAFDTDDAQLVESVAEHVGVALRIAELYHNLEQTHLGTAAALATALEAKDSYTADHAHSIAEMAVAVGRELGLDDSALRDLRYAAIFHDIGKIAIPDAVLNKPEALTATELDVVRRHPVVGEQILAPVPFLAAVREMVRHDHERWDGGGYPDGLRGEEIPLGARIVLVVDAYHAMTSDRPYRRSLGATAARRELCAGAGAQFDPRVVEALLTVLEQRPDDSAPSAAAGVA
jgi:diguanylate cyclase (GGDEF)-like protein